VSTDCERIRALLHEGGPAALEDRREDQEHVADCDACFDLLTEVEAMDAELADLPAPTLDPRLRQQVIWSARVAAATEPTPRPRRFTRLRSIGGVMRARPGRAVGGLAAALLMFGLFPLFVMSHMDADRGPAQDAVVDRFVQLRVPEVAERPEGAGWGVAGKTIDPGDELEITRERLLEQEQGRRQRVEESVASNGTLAIVGPGATSRGSRVADLLSDSGSLSDDVGDALAAASGLRGPDLAYPAVELPVDVPDDGKSRGREWGSDEDASEGEDSLAWHDEGRFLPPAETLDYRVADADGDGAKDKREEKSGERAVGPLRNPTAAEWIADNEVTEQVRFQASSGYWENTYVPGDPTLRRLHRRLDEADRSVLGVDGAEGLLLDAAARQYSQPFDAPTDSALAVYVHGDRRGVQDTTRMRIQVGVQATERASGRRSAMNIGVVLDLRGELGDDDAAAVRALLSALSQARDPGDTMSLTVAGRPGGMVLPPGEFRNGPVTVALEDLLGAEASDDDDRATLDLPAAFALAARSVQEADDPTQPLGSSMVLLVTADDLAGLDDRLPRLAHDSAVAGVPTSVVGVGGDLDMHRLEAVALAGQGNRRLLASPAEARALGDRELTAVSHVVARAVRLRIKLAPGVQLVGVLGADRLDALRSDQVREAEASIDQRLSRNLGIDADRGEDEEGIQIVVPTWYSGDAHVVLLDVVVPGPGPVAEVTVRYKDLVHLRNGVARSGLQLGRDPRAPGPLEHNVTRNVLALELSHALADASALLGQGRGDEATVRLAELAALVRDLQREAPAIYDNPEVHADVAMLDEYTALLQGGGAQAGAAGYLRDSLHYAARNKSNPALHAALR